MPPKRVVEKINTNVAAPPPAQSTKTGAVKGGAMRKSPRLIEQAGPMAGLGRNVSIAPPSTQPPQRIASPPAPSHPKGRVVSVVTSPPPQPVKPPTVAPAAPVSTPAQNGEQSKKGGKGKKGKQDTSSTSSSTSQPAPAAVSPVLPFAAAATTPSIHPSTAAATTAASHILATARVVAADPHHPRRNEVGDLLRSHERGWIEADKFQQLLRQLLF